MRYAIVINLDYNSYHADDCKLVWQVIREKMLEAGFIMDKRLLTLNKTKEQTCDLAREVIEKLNFSREVKGVDVFNYLKDFYAYDHSNAVNLLLPKHDRILLELR